MGDSTGAKGTGAGAELVLVGAGNGVVVVSADTPLKRLNYFDGKFLRAEDMQAEQEYLRRLVQLSNTGGGSGVVNGFDATLARGGAAVTVRQGLAIDPRGRVLLLAVEKTMLLDDLVAASQKADPRLPGPAGPATFGDCVVAGEPPPTTDGPAGDLYLLTVSSIEALCGEEDVFGRLCEDACVQAKDRRWRMEGVVFRALPLPLRTALRTSAAVPVNANQLRSRVASAWFEDERLRVASLVRGESLKGSAAFCLGAQAEVGDAVPLAVFARSGGVTRFLDAWTVRRERIEAPPRRYWASRLAMRPWDAFLAQVLQFQCQLKELLAARTGGGARILVDGGILELPAAGYLPVDAAGEATVNEQVRALVGPGLDLRYCIVTPDYVPHALEMRQHMERISLLDGLERPDAKPKVDVLVPGGRIVEDRAGARGKAFRLVGAAPSLFGEPVQGAANAARRGERGASFTLAGTSPDPRVERIAELVRRFASGGEAAPAPVPAPRWTPVRREHLALVSRIAAASIARAGLALQPPRLRPLLELPAAEAGDAVGAVESTATIDADPFQLEVSGSTQLQLDLLLGIQGDAGSLVRLAASGTLYLRSKGTKPGGIEYASGTISGSFAVGGAGKTSPGQVAAWKYQLERRSAADGGGSIAGVLTADGLPSFSFSHEWKGSPLQGRLQVYRFATGVEAIIGPALAFARVNPLFQLDLTEDAAVLAPTEANHVLAEAALAILAAMLPNGADWHKATQAALFPKPAGGSDNLTVVGERDWVLFARRRLDTCAEEVVTPSAPDRRYHVYLREARSEEDAKKWLELVLSREGSPLEGAQFVGLVDFDGETDEPLDPAALRTALLPVKGQSLAFVVVASEYGGGVAEEGRRRAHLEQAVSEVVDVTGSVPIDRGALPAKFQGRIDGGETVHGVVVLVTLQQVAVANAYGLNTDFALRSVLARDAAGAITVRDPAELGEVQPRSRLLLGPVTFRSGVPDAAQLAAVVEKWKALRIALGHVVSVTAKAEHDAAAAAERDAIAAATGPLQPPQAWSAHATAGFDTAPEGLNAMVFLVGEPVILLRGVVALLKPDGVRTVKPLLDEGKVHEVLDSAALSRFVELVPSAEFDPETGALRNPEEVRRAWRGVIGDAPPAAVMTFAKGDEDATLTKVIRAQAKSAGAAAGGEPRVSLLRVTDAREIAEGRPREVFHFLLPRQG